VAGIEAGGITLIVWPGAFLYSFTVYLSVTYNISSLSAVIHLAVKH
jgi:hypothetical protein